MVLHKSIVCRGSEIAGKGLYATAAIKKGEVVWTANENEKSFWHHIDEIHTWPEEEQKQFLNGAYLVAKDTYSGVRSGQESDKGEYMNHCCDPNVVFVGDDLCIAWRDIEPDEEVTYDYGTSEIPGSSHMPFKCGCGANTCRGTITVYDCCMPELREKYAGHFTTLAVEFQKENDAKKAAEAAAGTEQIH